MGLLGGGWDDPQTQFNMALASGLLSGRGNFGQVVGGALPMAMQARQQANSALMQKQLLESQIGENNAQAQQRLAQIQKAHEEAQKSMRAQEYLRSLGTVDLKGGPRLDQQDVKPKEFNLSEFLANDGTLQAAEQYTKLSDSLKPKFDWVEKVQTPEGKRFALMSKGGEFKTLPWLTPADKEPLVNVDVAGKQWSKELIGAAVDRLKASTAKAEAATKNIGTVSRMRDALSGGILPTGPGATFGQGISRFVDMIGIGGKDNSERLANTTSFIQGAASLALDSAAKMKGQGSVTEEERKLLQRATLGGDNILNMRTDEIVKLLDIIDKQSREDVTSHKNLINLMPKDIMEFMPLFQVPDLPPMMQTHQVAPSMAAPHGQPRQERRINRPSIDWNDNGR